MSEIDDRALRLPWHEALWRHMSVGLAADRVAHGVLVAGTPGVGKRRFAWRLVAALLCRELSDDGEACGAMPRMSPARGGHASGYFPAHAGRYGQGDQGRPGPPILACAPSHAAVFDRAGRVDRSSRFIVDQRREQSAQDAGRAAGRLSYRAHQRSRLGVIAHHPQPMPDLDRARGRADHGADAGWPRGISTRTASTTTVCARRLRC